MCIPILVTTFPEWLSGTEQLPHIRRRASVCVVFVVFCVHMHSFPGLIRRTPVTLQSPTATLIPLFSSSELTGLLDRKNRLDMCPRWESNPRLPVCKASTLSTRPGSPLYLDDTLFTGFYRQQSTTTVYGSIRK